MNVISNRQRGLTLIELLAAMASVGLVIGVATGLAITSIARHKISFDASELEAQHAQLANAIFAALKTADSFQIFDSSKSADALSPAAFGAGTPSGNYLSCRHRVTAGNGTGSLIEQNFELVRGTNESSSSLIQTTRFTSTAQQETRREFLGVISAGPIFTMQNGIPQAHWSVATAVDRADFNVYAMPLSMR
jgi:type II secretory pathway pseudopilin PulG